MNQINLYLEKFKNLLPYDSKIKQAIISSVQKHTRIHLDSQSIQVTERSIFINASPLIKSEILIHMLDIQKDVEEALSSKYPIR